MQSKSKPPPTPNPQTKTRPSPNIRTKTHHHRVSLILERTQDMQKIHAHAHTQSVLNLSPQIRPILPSHPHSNLQQQRKTRFIASATQLSDSGLRWLRPFDREVSVAPKVCTLRSYSRGPEKNHCFPYSWNNYWSKFNIPSNNCLYKYNDVTFPLKTTDLIDCVRALTE